MPGRDLECGARSPGATCLVFTGILVPDEAAAGYAPETAGAFTLSVVIHEGSPDVEGAYRIGPVGHHDHDQLGTLALSIAP
jgi:hypothetical protein